MKCEICKKKTANGKILKDLCKYDEEGIIYDAMSKAIFIDENKKIEKQYEKWLEEQ